MDYHALKETGFTFAVKVNHRDHAALVLCERFPVPHPARGAKWLSFNKSDPFVEAGNMTVCYWAVSGQNAPSYLLYNRLSHAP